jgi:death-on-curing protein
MTEEPIFLTVEQVLTIHERVIAEFGGDAALLDRGLLESAVAMPAARYSGAFLHPDLPTMASAYLFHLCRNHPFADGNKCTALTSAEVLLLLNDHRLKATNRDLERLVLGIAGGRLSKDDTAAFLQKQVIRARR